MSNEQKDRPRFGFNQRGLSFEGKFPYPSDWGLKSRGMRFETTPEIDTDLHLTEQDCPRAYRRSLKR